MSNNGNSSFPPGGFIRPPGQSLLPLPNPGLGFPPGLVPQGGFPLPTGMPSMPPLFNIPAAPSPGIMPVPPVPILSSHNNILPDNPDANTVFIPAAPPPPPPVFPPNMPNFLPPISSLPTTSSIPVPPPPPKTVEAQSSTTPTVTSTVEVQVQVSASEKVLPSNTSSKETSEPKNVSTASDKSSKDEKPASTAKPKTVTAGASKPLLGKLVAKKRLQAFSGKTSFALSKPGKSVPKNALNEGEEEESAKAPEDAESKKPQLPKKKKKEEKMSVIEQIRVEESRIREALGVHGMHFNPYTPQFAAFLDNPESLKRLEEKGKDYIERLEKRRQEEERREQEKKERKEREKKERELERIRKKEKEKERLKYEKEREARRAKEKELKASKEAENAENKVQRSSRTSSSSSRGEKHERSGSRTEREKLRVPRDWEEFRKVSVPWEEYQKFVRASKEIQRERKLIENFNVVSKDSDATVTFPGRNLQHTLTKPSISFSENPQTYKDFYMSRQVARASLSSEELEIVEKIWNAQYLQCPDTLPDDSLEFSQTFWYDEDWLLASSGRLSRQSVSKVPSKWDSDDENNGPDRDYSSESRDSKIDYSVDPENGNDSENEEKGNAIPVKNDTTQEDVFAREEEGRETKSSSFLAPDVSSTDGDSTRDAVEPGMADEYEAFMKMVGSDQSERPEVVDSMFATDAQQDVLEGIGKESSELLENDTSVSESQLSAAEMKKMKKQQRKEKKKAKKAAKKLKKALKKAQKKAERKRKKAIQAELEKGQADEDMEKIETSGAMSVSENLQFTRNENKPESFFDESTNSSAGVSNDGSLKSAALSPQPYSPSSAYSSISSPGSSCSNELSPSASEMRGSYTPPPLPPKINTELPVSSLNSPQLPPLPPLNLTPPLPPTPVPSTTSGLPPLPTTPAADQLPPLPGASSSRFPVVSPSSTSSPLTSSSYGVPPPPFTGSLPPLPLQPPSTGFKPPLPSVPPPPIPSAAPPPLPSAAPPSTSSHSHLSVPPPRAVTSSSESSPQMASPSHLPVRSHLGTSKQDLSTLCVLPPLPPGPAQDSQQISRKFPENQKSTSQTLDIPMPSMGSGTSLSLDGASLPPIPKRASSASGNADETEVSSQNVKEQIQGEDHSTLPESSDPRERKSSTAASKETRSIIFKLDSMKTSSKILRKSALSGFDDDDPKSSKLPALSSEALERYKEAKVSKSSTSEQEPSSSDQGQAEDDDRETSSQNSGFGVLAPLQDPSKSQSVNKISESEFAARAESKLIEKDAVDRDRVESSREGSQLTDNRSSPLDHKQDAQYDPSRKDERSKYFSPVRRDGHQESPMLEKSSESREASSDDRRGKSPERKPDASPDRKKTRSPDWRRDRSPDRKRNRSPDRKRDRSPERKRDRSPDRKRDRSPDRKRDRSPDRKRDRSPDRKRDRSPDRKRRRSPDRKRERSPDRKRERSPDRRREKSPDRRREKSPGRRREKSPDRRRERSPERRRMRSPERQQDRSRDRSPMRRQEESRDRSPRSSRRIQGDSKDRLRSPERRSNQEFPCDRQTRARSSSPSRDQNRRSPDRWQSDGRADRSGDSRGERSGDGSRQGSPTRSMQDSSPKKIPSIVQLQYNKSTEMMSEEEHRPEWNYDPAELDESLFQEWQTHNPPSSNNVLIDTSLAGSNDSLPTDAPPLPIPPVTPAQTTNERTGNRRVNTGEFSPSPPCSPERRLSLDDRLAKEHGLLMDEELEPPLAQGDAANAAWKAPTYSAPSATAASNAIQVGNMLQILPQEIPTPVGPPPTASLPPKQDLSSVDIIARISDELRARTGKRDPVKGTAGPADHVGGDQATPNTNMLPLIVAGAAAAAASSTSPNAVAQLISLIQQTANRAPTGATEGPVPPPPPLPMAEPTEEMKQLQQEELLKQQQQQELLKQQQQHARKLRKERREKRRLEREARRAARRSAEEQKTAAVQQQDSDDDDEATIREAISEEPNLGSPVAEYELEAEAEEAHAASLRQAEEAMEMRLKKYMPAPAPDRGILMSPNYRIHGGSSCKSVKFADGVLPGEGTSPSGGEEIHSPPPPLSEEQEDGSGAPAARPPREKKLRKKNKPRTRAIKLFEGVSEADVLSASPPPPPASPPPGCTPIFLYPGYSHFTLSEPGTAILYTNPQPPPSAPHTPNGLPPQGARYDMNDGSSPFVGAYDGGTVGFPAMNGSPFPAHEGGSPFVSQSTSIYDPAADR